MTPIPQAAMPVVEEIRRLVPRPSGLPAPYGPYYWTGVLRFDKRYCPLGLMPDADSPAPCAEKGTPEEAFIDWWYEQTDAQAAVDAVWGTR